MINQHTASNKFKSVVKRILDWLTLGYATSHRSLINKNKLLSRELEKWKVGMNPPGHFYNPFPFEKEIENYKQNPLLDDINLNETHQLKLVKEIAQHYTQLPFSFNKSSKFHYYYDNNYFTYADATLSFCLLLHWKPNKIIEIGSGFSSALMLDVNNHFMHGSLDITFIEPYPARLKSLLEPKSQHKLIEKPVQEVDIKEFEKLKAGDILFIDSSHVSKHGSDVNYILFSILPRIRKGVFIHIHDVFYPFTYPREWLRQGRGWNEAYMIRSFLSYNQHFQIELFADFLIQEHTDWFKANMPQCLMSNSIVPDFRTGKPIELNTNGQSLWLQKIQD
jgi:hypothetical protein